MRKIKNLYSHSEPQYPSWCPPSGRTMEAEMHYNAFWCAGVGVRGAVEDFEISLPEPRTHRQEMVTRSSGQWHGPGMPLSAINYFLAA